MRETLEKIFALVIGVLIALSVWYAPVEFKKPEKLNGIISVESKLVGKTAKERYQIKGQEIAKLNIKGNYTKHGLDIEIQNILETTGGVELYARAWKDGKQIGFSKDGSVEWERFIFINPPILVPDQLGTIERQWSDKNPRTGAIIRSGVLKYREDPTSAIKDALAHTIKIVGKENTKVTTGKVGRTTLTCYPDAGSGGTTVDGRTINVSPAGQNWAAARDDTVASEAVQVTNVTAAPIDYKNDGDRHSIGRVIITCDTSAIGSGTVDSATFSAVATAITNDDNDGDDYIAVTVTSPASNNNLVQEDFDRVKGTDGNFPLGATVAMQEQHATTERKDITSITADSATYTTWTLDATGIANIITTGISLFGLNEGHDILNHEGVLLEDQSSGVTFIMADTAGTTTDSKLVIEYTAAAAGTTDETPLFYDIF